ncbi:protein sarah-like [Macrosteles quadrilineatus]|uniref:protein sarah-like n=1 Tax=Macrosteles quadrilineatus TaxID=74068 RepID=UPI0023E298AF|nr:protein sarah-like [Macrosteles quadrilineatus]XP_054271051.1 protein sarah-like [Macrosteles quadrilineatus]XP_054271290.1 protein sarah-like [Macrosteles quadrilineatus]XP_054271291.1 protein sarah-like [Macrosteles quadrilineatus]
MDEGRMSVDSDEGEMIINEIDGLPNLHPNYNDLQLNQPTSQIEPRTIDELIHDEDLPMSVIVTNLDNSLFKKDDLKKEIEALFKQFGEVATFQYFRSFRRMRVNYSCPTAAAKARIQMHQTQFLNSIINCYFAQPVTPIDAADQHLQPPALTKQFLISPPASPPIGWEPRDEGEPLVNYDLLAAIANLTPGETHELHAASGSQPGIVVHVCEEGVTAGVKGARIAHTRCPQPDN